MRERDEREREMRERERESKLSSLACTVETLLKDTSLMRTHFLGPVVNLHNHVIPQEKGSTVQHPCIKM